MKVQFNEDHLIAQQNYQEAMDQEILPWLQAREQVTTLPGFEGRPLYCVRYDAERPQGTVVIVHGFTENALKYAELIYSLLQKGFSVLAYDQRGHGRSWRAEGIPDGSVTHVDHFSDYVEDLKSVCDDLLSNMPKPWLLFSHSMGGAVSTFYLEDHPETFSAAVLCAPMIAPNLSGLPPAAAALISSAAISLQKARKNPPFMKPYAGPEDFATSCATDPARFAWYDAIKASHPEFQNSVPSWQWIREAVRVTKQLLAEGRPEGIACPVLLSTADEDSSVLPEPQKALIERIPHGERIFVKGSRHEIYRSANEVLFPWWHRMLAFLHEAAGSASKGTGEAS